MAMRWFHPEEEATIGVLLAFCNAHPDALLAMTYEDGGVYRCKFCDSYDSDNEYAVEAGVETELVEYVAVLIELVELARPNGEAGLEAEPASDSHRVKPGSLIEISYRDFPSRIVAEDGTVVYESAR